MQVSHLRSTNRSAPDWARTANCPSTLIGRSAFPLIFEYGLEISGGLGSLYDAMVSSAVTLFAKSDPVEIAPGSSPVYGTPDAEALVSLSTPVTLGAGQTYTLRITTGQDMQQPTVFTAEKFKVP